MGSDANNLLTCTARGEWSMNKLAAFALTLMPAIVAAAEPAAGKAPTALLAAPETSSANSASREWFRNARFGMFIHWGVYSVPARGEWVMETEGWAIGDYDRYGRTAGRTGGGDFARYLAFMNAQLTELLTHYGEIGGIWFDGMWDKPDADWHLDETYALIHRLQPGALVGSNHHATPYPGEDFQIFEKDLPGKNTAGFNQSGISALPLETCDTLNDSWGFNARDNKFKDPKDIIRTLVRTSGQDANLLLNIGPTAM